MNCFYTVQVEKMNTKPDNIWLGIEVKTGDVDLENGNYKTITKIAGVYEITQRILK